MLFYQRGALGTIVASWFLQCIVSVNPTDHATSTLMDKSTKTYYHVPKYSMYKAEGDLGRCNLTFYLLQYSIYDSKKECHDYSSLVLGLEELMPFYYSVRKSLMPKSEIIFPLRNVAQSGTQFRVILSQYRTDYNMEIEIKKINMNKENNVICVKFHCPKIEAKKECKPITNSSAISKPRVADRYSDTWFTIALSLMILVVLVIICILIYLVLSNKRKPKAHIVNEVENGKDSNNLLSPCNSFDAYDFLRKIDSRKPCLSETYAKHGNIYNNLHISDANNTSKSSTSMIILNREKTVGLNLTSDPTSPRIDHLEMLNNKVKTLPLIKKRSTNESNRSTPSPIYSSMSPEPRANSFRTNPSFRSY